MKYYCLKLFNICIKYSSHFGIKIQKNDKYIVTKAIDLITTSDKSFDF